MLRFEREVREHIQSQLLRGQGEDLTSTTPMLELGILDSFSMLKLVEWIEQRYSLSIQSSEVTAENFNTINQIASLIDRKVGDLKAT